MNKKSFGYEKKSFGSHTDTKIGPWLWFPTPKPDFGRTLVSSNKLTFTLLVRELDLLVIVETIKSRSDKKGPLIDAITQN